MNPNLSEGLVALSCPTVCDPIDCSLPGSSVHGILQAKILEWIAMPSSRAYSQPGIEPRSSTLQADSLPSEPPGKPSFSSLTKKKRNQSLPAYTGSYHSPLFPSTSSITILSATKVLVLFHILILIYFRLIKIHI